MQNRADYLAGLPRRRIAAGAVIRDQEGRVCLVEPTYKQYWHLPGGTVEADESPSAGCRRELQEELGLDLPVGPMLCSEWIAPADGDPYGALIMVYDGGVLDEQKITEIVTPPEELHGFTFVALDQLESYANERNCRRIRTAIDNLGGQLVELDPL